MLEHIELRRDVLVSQPGEPGPASKLGVVGSGHCGGLYSETLQMVVERGNGGPGMYPVDHFPGIRHDTGSLEYFAHVNRDQPNPANETIAYHQLLGQLARSALAVITECGSVGAFDLLTTIADRHGVTEDDAANAVARLRGAVEIDESVPSDLRYVAVSREQR